MSGDCGVLRVLYDDFEVKGIAGFSERDKIAEMAGIPSALSDEINRFMDDMNPPKEFEDQNTERKIFVCGHLNVSIRTLEAIKSKLKLFMKCIMLR